MRPDEQEWHLPADKMKMHNAHIVPISHKARAILCDLKPLTGRCIYVFPSQGKRRAQHASNGTINKVLQKTGVDTSTTHYKHGARGHRTHFV